MDIDSVRQTIWGLAEPLVEAEGFELVDVDYVQEHRWVLRLFIERPNAPVIEGLGVAPGEGVSLDDCIKVSREFSALLDVEDSLPHAFNLEVSSPGARRPLRKTKDFQKFIGCQVRVRTKQQITAFVPEGVVPSRNIYGLLEEANDDWVQVKVEKRRYRIPHTIIVRAHLEPDMDSWMSLAKQMQADKSEGV